MPLKAAPPPVAAYDWSGFYIGGVIGGGWTNTDSSVPGLGIVGALVNAPVIQTTTTSSSFIGGVEGGDRYQFGKFAHRQGRLTVRPFNSEVQRGESWR